MSIVSCHVLARDISFLHDRNKIICGSAVSVSRKNGASCAARAAVMFNSRAMKQHVESICSPLQLGSPSMERLHNSSELECSEACGKQHVNNMFVGPRLHLVLLVYRVVREVEKPDEQCYPRYFLKQMPVRRIVAIGSSMPNLRYSY